MKKLILTALVLVFALAAPALRAEERGKAAEHKAMKPSPVAACAKMGCMEKDKDGNLVCSKDHHVLAAKHDCGKGMVMYTDTADNMVDENGDILAGALRGKNGRPFYMLADGKTASACPMCATGKCGKECPAPMLKASEVHVCGPECKHANMSFADSMAMMMKDMPKDKKDEGKKQM